MKSLPTWLVRLLRAICPDELVDQIEGDLIELYNHDVKRVGERKARVNVVLAALRFVRPGIVFRNKFSYRPNHADMLLLHLKFASRLFLKDRVFSVLNTLGLALGIAIGMVLLLILQADLTYDQHYTHHERIYRLGAHYQIPGTDVNTGVTASELAPILTDVYPEIEALVRIKMLGRTLVKFQAGKEEKSFFEEHVVQADSSYFSVFSHGFLVGNVRTCLRDPHSVVMTEAVAAKYFDKAENALDQTVLIAGEPRKIAGVIRDLPEDTHLKFDILLSGLPAHRDWTVEEGKPISLAFWNPDVFTYLVLPPDYAVSNFYSRFQPIYNQYFKPTGDESGGNNTPILQPLKDIHFSGFDDDLPDGNWTYLYAFSGIGLMIILLACINYMNLSTAKAVNRAKEIAVKKIVGSRKRSLVLCFLAESVLMSFASLVVAIGLVLCVLHTTSFNDLIGKDLSLDFPGNPVLVVGSLVITLSIGIISGLYPALYLPLIPAVSAVKGVFKNRKHGAQFRKVLIAVQFGISIFVVTCTLFMKNQVDYVQNKDLGFDKNNVLVIPVNDSVVHGRISSIKNELLSDHRVISVAASQSLPGLGIGGNIMFGESEAGMQKQGGILGLFVGDDYLKTMGIQLISGRDFQPGDNVDEDGMYIANESVVKLMGWGDNALGKKVTFWGGENPGTVIGVVKDFNASSLHRPADPMFIVKGHWDTGYMQVRITGEDLPETIRAVKAIFGRYDSNHPFEYFFLDQRFNEQYKEDILQNKLLSALAAICIFISLLGLIGLSAFTAAQRTKEIGIRKVLGAKVFDIIFLLAKDVFLLVVISAVLVIPATAWVIAKWLENFAYRDDINYLLYVSVVSASIAIVFIVILLQSLKTARTNPVESLKYE